VVKTAVVVCMIGASRSMLTTICTSRGGGERYAAYGTDFHAVHFYRRSFGEAQTAATVYFIPDAIASDR
jgi:hypothetical protein